jgi:hypothetical protein
MLFHYNLGRPQRHPLPRPLPFWGLIRRRTLCGRALVSEINLQTLAVDTRR